MSRRLPDDVMDAIDERLRLLLREELPEILRGLGSVVPGKKNEPCDEQEENSSMDLTSTAPVGALSSEQEARTLLARLRQRKRLMQPSPSSRSRRKAAR
jgi:hypothetical protein